jgi:16S rRNA (uracil1498-N3)-methyltransferase
VSADRPDGAPRAPRFFVDAPLAIGQSVPLPQPVAHHALRTLRLREGTTVVLFNGTGGEYRGLLTAGGSAGVALQAFDPVERESPLSVTVVQALASADKLDWVLEKGTELGAAAFSFWPAERSVGRVDAARRPHKLAHWREVCVAACGQCGRNRVPPVTLAASLADALASVPPEALGFVLATGRAAPLRIAEGSRPVAVLVGPEGGLTERETAQALRAGWIAASLGPRVLRTETAGLAALVRLQACTGDA